LTLLPVQALSTAVVAIILFPLLRKIDPGQDRPEIGALR
jgi:hypothetical protein